MNLNIYRTKHFAIAKNLTVYKYYASDSRMDTERNGIRRGERIYLNKKLIR